ncbi:class V lanthionine synthetase subunit LxmK [Allokutzneria sp. A3M-2-11 16]|uniref:class V lanthionine synthetase subunit LxmK n=1 Tax=Allokutzneria sp. A3M-2-11 16 TaxID=2962043 RepID=UPI0020B767EB|nr:class V lanthionine synthetase subunit LxmK [Allokutzneria sp. A3M-2-11 16]MCP3802649.1 class V lanthionine synthetase subunit LxmK [Allokutzneria sp. A3M-2-11 16]
MNSSVKMRTPNPVIAEPVTRELFDRLGLGEAVDDGAVSFPGRNDNWAGPTTSGAEVFVKRTSEGGMHRAVAFELFASGHAPKHLRTPSCLGWDEGAGLHVTRLLRDCVPGDELADDGRFGSAAAEATGLAIGELHGWAPTPEVVAHEEVPILGSIVRLFDGLPLPVYLEATGAELEVWRLVRHDRPLRAALDALAGQDSVVVLRPVHGDLRLDQLQVAGDTVYLTDWEEFGLADPAVDVGAFVGQWLLRAVLGITGPDRQVAETSLSHNDIIQRTREVRPVVNAFWAGYRAARGEVEDGLAERATAFAGWHVFDRVTAAGQPAGAGIGRKLLLDPDRFVEVIGLGTA